MSMSAYIDVDTLLWFSLIIIVLIYLYLEWKYSYWKRLGVPHVQATSLIFGNIGHFLFPKGNGENFYQEIYNSHKGKPFVGYYEFQNPVLMIKDLDIAKKVLSQNFNSFRDQRFSISSRIDPIMARNPLNRTYHNKWKESRAVLSPGLTLGKLRSCPEVFLKPYSDLTKFIDNNQGDLELSDLAKRVTCDVVASLGWGVEGNACSEIESPIYEMFNKIQPETYELETIVVNKFIAKIFGFRVFSKQQTDFFLDLTRKCIECSSASKVGSPCLLQSLLHSKTEGFFSENDGDFIMEITASLCVFFLDGFFTASAILSYVLYELMLNKEVQSKLRDEIEGLDNNLAVENVEKLEYLNMVISETHRLRTIVHYLGRTCTEACTLGDVELRPGTEVIVPISAIHMDPQYYPNPEQFNPENFSEEKRKERHPYAFLPFGNGPRLCLGTNFASTHLKMIISNLIRDYEIVAPTNHEYGPMSWEKSKPFLQYVDKEMFVGLRKLHH